MAFFSKIVTKVSSNTKTTGISSLIKKSFIDRHQKWKITSVVKTSWLYLVRLSLCGR